MDVVSTSDWLLDEFNKHIVNVMSFNKHKNMRINKIKKIFNI
jgi:hypothetical protein